VSGAPGYVEQNNPSRKVPALVMHGTADNTFDYTDAENLVGFWNDHNNATLSDTELLPDTDPSDSCTVERLTYTDADQSCEVLLYKIIDGGHLSWPGAFWHPDTLQYMNMDISANEEIWSFFSRYHLSDFTSIAQTETTSINLKVFPVPSSLAVTFTYELEIAELVRISFYDQFGKQVDRIEQKQTAGKQQVVWTPELPGGIYYFRLEAAGRQISSGKVVLVR